MSKKQDKEIQKLIDELREIMTPDKKEMLIGFLKGLIERIKKGLT